MNFFLKTTTPEHAQTRLVLEGMIHSAIQAADPYLVVKNHLRVDNSALFVGDRIVEIGNGIAVIAIGKAGNEMLRAATDLLGTHICGGICVSKTGSESDFGKIKKVVSDHPHPSSRSQAAAIAVKEFAHSLTPNIPVLCLISGGGSSLVCLPRDAISLEDYSATNRLMLTHELRIDEINTVRKHLDAIKGGGLLKWLGKRQVIQLVLSDVLIGGLPMVASGPLCQDETTFQDAINILVTHDLWKAIPESIRAYLDRGSSGDNQETLKPEEMGDYDVLTLQVGGIEQSIQAAADEALRLGWKVGDKQPFLTGKLEPAIQKLGEAMDTLKGIPKSVQIFGSEIILQVKGHGIGGRNSHLMLSLAEKLQNSPGITLSAVATDGEDGNSPAAGAVVDSHTYTRAVQHGCFSGYYLTNANSYEFFKVLNDAIKTGSTGTNVNDLIFIINENEI